MRDERGPLPETHNTDGYSDTAGDHVKSVSEETGDDGRTIADMNVEGMPWYVPGDENRSKGHDKGMHTQMTDSELRMYRFAALKAGLLMILVFGGAFFLFLLFCDFVWFR